MNAILLDRQGTVVSQTNVPSDAPSALKIAVALPALVSREVAAHVTDGKTWYEREFYLALRDPKGRWAIYEEYYP